MPGDAAADSRTVVSWEAAVRTIERPVTDAEAVVLIDALPHDETSCFGLAWGLVHAIETAPGYGVEMVKRSAAVGEWRATLLQRLHATGPASD
jgi:hypothetical protein